MKGLAAVLALLLALGVFFLLYRSAPPPADMTEAESAQIEAAVLEVADQSLMAWNALDPEALAPLYDSSSMHGHDGPVYFATYEQWMAHFKELLGGFETMNVEWTDKRVDVLAPDVALFAGQGDFRGRQDSGREVRIEGYITQVFRNSDAGWKIIHQASLGRWTTVEEG